MPSKLDKTICERVGVVPQVPANEDKIGIALHTLGDSPLNGLRHAPESGTCGWYIWGGELDPSDQEEDFFSPLHVAHLLEYYPTVLPYLSLPPGWRFLLAAEYEDVWQDPALVSTGWPFDQAENVAAVSDELVIDGAPVQMVIHYSDDHSWAFLSGEVFETAQGKVIGMGTALKRDPTLRTIADLPRGWVATRRHVGGTWKRRFDPNV